MNPTRILFTVLAVSTSFLAMGNAVAQQERDVIEVIKTQVQSQRQELVAENLRLSEEESSNFWPVYREFHSERDALVDRRIGLLKKFRDNFDGLSEEQSAELLDDYFSLQEDILKLRKKFLKKFRKVLSEKSTLRYFQIENKLDSIIENELAQVVPLAE
jgi:hypothetical protein